MSKRKIIKLRDCKTKKWTGDKFVVISLYDSPFYLSLKKNDEYLYEEYRDLVNSTCPWVKQQYTKRKCCSFKTFYNLYLSIKTEYKDKPRNRIIFHKGFDEHIIQDGQHRASILLYLNENTEILRDGRLGLLVKKEHYNNNTLYYYIIIQNKIKSIYYYIKHSIFRL